jgi:hypothetical protein
VSVGQAALAVVGRGSLLLLLRLRVRALICMRPASRLQVVRESKAQT